MNAADIMGRGNTVMASTTSITTMTMTVIGIAATIVDIESD